MSQLVQYQILQSVNKVNIKLTQYTSGISNNNNNNIFSYLSLYLLFSQQIIDNIIVLGFYISVFTDLQAKLLNQLT